MELRRSYYRLISTMGFPILVRWHIYIESGPWRRRACSCKEHTWRDHDAIQWAALQSPHAKCVTTLASKQECALIARFMGPTWGPSGADRTQVGPLLAPRTLLSGAILPPCPIIPNLLQCRRYELMCLHLLRWCFKIYQRQILEFYHANLTRCSVL